MKNSTYLIILLALGLVFTSYKWITATSSPSYNTQPEQQEQQEASDSKGNRFVEFDVREQWNENPFDFFRGDGLLLAAGNKESNNAMTIGWGALGNIWNRDASTVTVYVAEGRYTFGFMEKSKYFTVMQFDEKHADVLRYMGSHSGRDGDKAEALGLHTLYTENGTPYYAEAELVLECEMLYHYKFETEGMSDGIRDFYKDFRAGVHHQYIGKIVKAMRKE